MIDINKIAEYRINTNNPLNPFMHLSDEKWAAVVVGNIDPYRYSVSSFGKILDRYHNSLVAQFLVNGYLAVNLCTITGDRVRAQVHRLVGAAFVPNLDPINKININHIDGNRCNNIYNNLEWVSQSENIQHAIFVGLTKIGTDKTEVYLTNEDVHFICQSLSEIKTYDYIITELMSRHPEYEYDKLRGEISNIKEDKTFRHISCKYDIHNKHRNAKYSRDEINKMIAMLQSEDTTVGDLMQEFNIPDDGRKAFQQFISDVIRRKKYSDFSEGVELKYPIGMINRKKRFTEEQRVQIAQCIRDGKSYDEILTILYGENYLKETPKDDIVTIKKALQHIKMKNMGKLLGLD